MGTFSSRYHQEIHFHKGSNKETLLNEISNLNYKPGNRNIMQALVGSIQLMVRPKSGERRYATKIMILVTGGSVHQRANRGLTAALRANRVTVFVVEVTAKARTSDNRALVVDDDHIFYLSDFSGLSTLPDLLLTTLCHGRYVSQFSCCSVVVGLLKEVHKLH